MECAAVRGLSPSSLWIDRFEVMVCLLCDLSGVNVSHVQIPDSMKSKTLVWDIFQSFLKPPASICSRL